VLTTCHQCNQAKDRPCNNCSRRYPPVACVYEGIRSARLLQSSQYGNCWRILTKPRKLSKYKETIIELGVTLPKIEESEASSSEVLATVEESKPDISDKVSSGAPNLQLLTHNSRKSRWAEPVWWAEPVAPAEDEPQSPDGASDISPSIRILQYYPFSDHFRKSYYGVPKMRVGSAALEPLHSLPIETSMRHAPLLPFCMSHHHFLDYKSDKPQSSKDWLLTSHRSMAKNHLQHSETNGCHC